MHPELQAIEDQYLALVSATQAGHMSEDEAVATIARVTAVDGDGAVWSIDPYSGQFTRAFPGQMPEPANPSLFAPSRLPAPPVDFGMPGTPAGPAGWPAPGGGAALPPELAYPPAGAPAGGAAKKGGRSLAALVKGRGRTLALVVGVIVVLLLMVVAKSGGSSPEPAPTPVQTPAASAPAAVPAADGPTAEEQAKLVQMLASGKQKTVMGLLQTVPDKAGTLLSVAGLSGARALGFTLEPAGVNTVNGGLVLVVRAVGAGSERGSFAVPVVRGENGWQVAGLVVFTPGV